MFFGNNSCIWIILILIFFACGGGNGFGINNGCGCNNGCGGCGNGCGGCGCNGNYGDGCC